MNKKLTISIISGSLLEIICIIGGGIRMGFSGNSIWCYNSSSSQKILI